MISIRLRGFWAGRMPVGPVGKARPVYLPNSTVLALASVASKSTVNHTGLPVAFKVHKPTLWSALPQLSMNLARSTSLCLKTALLLLVELTDWPVMSNSASTRPASAACQAICISLSLRVPRSAIIAIRMPPTPNIDTTISISMTMISDKPRCLAGLEEAGRGRSPGLQVGMSVFILGVAQMHGESQGLAQAAIKRGGVYAARVIAAGKSRAFGSRSGVFCDSEGIKGLIAAVRLGRTGWPPKHDANADAAPPAPVGVSGRLIDRGRLTAGHCQLVRAQIAVNNPVCHAGNCGVGRADTIDAIEHLEVFHPRDDGLGIVGGGPGLGARAHEGWLSTGAVLLHIKNAHQFVARLCRYVGCGDAGAVDHRFVGGCAVGSR